MRDSIAAFLTERNITGTVYCAVSGGADSMALLHCLWMLREQHHLTLCAVHFHHHLRGEAADRDAQFVAAFCDAYGIPLQTGHADTAVYAKARGQSVEPDGQGSALCIL